MATRPASDGERAALAWYAREAERRGVDPHTGLLLPEPQREAPAARPVMRVEISMTEVQSIITSLRLLWEALEQIEANAAVSCETQTEMHPAHRAILEAIRDRARTGMQQADAALADAVETLRAAVWGR